jgi:hypothetical protein
MPLNDLILHGAPQCHRVPRHPASPPPPHRRPPRSSPAGRGCCSRATCPARQEHELTCRPCCFKGNRSTEHVTTSCLSQTANDSRPCVHGMHRTSTSVHLPIAVRVPGCVAQPAVRASLTPVLQCIGSSATPPLRHSHSSPCWQRSTRRRARCARRSHPGSPRARCRPRRPPPGSPWRCLQRRWSQIDDRALGGQHRAASTPVEVTAKKTHVAGCSAEVAAATESQFGDVKAMPLRCPFALRGEPRSPGAVAFRWAECSTPRSPSSSCSQSRCASACSRLPTSCLRHLMPAS